ncbi:MAG: bifunctional oligoribonuclease/PAP phosphatase NrnA [Candidatus Omnitrophica bacterium]|nr:bifunctional oligoribonuclease/PAP phosphatase NrnA [Candidatus Omnitrophota bacterium]
MGLRQAAAAVRKNNSFVITAHVNPEGDALGSQIAFYNLLKKLGKEAVILDEDAVPSEYEFLPGQELVRKFKYNPRRRIGFDCLVVLDSSDLKRTGEVWRVNQEKKIVLNIDHHISNIKFGDVNWVEPLTSSASEMVYKLFKYMRVPLDADTALALYVGMMTDTGSFRYSNTTAGTHRAAAELMKYKIDTVQVYKNIYENIPNEEVKLLNKILPSVKRDCAGKLVWFQVPHDLLKGKKITFDLSEHILSFGRAMQGAEVVVLFKENLGIKREIRVNLRSQGKFDVNKVAQLFGGGGHKAAAGITMHGTITAVRKKVLAKIKSSL